MNNFAVIVILSVLMLGVVTFTSISAQENIIPLWVKNTAEFWVADNVSDTEFINSMKYLIENNILIIESTDSIADNGDFYITVHTNPNSPFEYSSANWLEDIEYLNEQEKFLNVQYRLPYDVEIIAKECGEANMFYDLETKNIVLCYEFIDLTYSDFENYYDDPELGITKADIENMVISTIDFVFYHEVGHALIDIYNLPVTGLEENVVDQFATLSVLMNEDVDETTIQGQNMLYDVGTWFFIQDELNYEKIYWDTHNLDAQRFYNISCYSYGQNPDYNQDLIDEGWLPVERADLCADEYSKMLESWNVILMPYYNFEF